MKSRLLCTATLLLIGAIVPARAQQQARIQSFSPQGTVKRIGQVRVQFSEPMVTFGDPRADLNPFDIKCDKKGTGRWADVTNWIYDFEEDLPAGVRCEFTLKSGIKSVRGIDFAGQRTFQFSTGGPAIVRSSPHEGSTVSDDQIFVLELDGAAADASVLSNVSFSARGISERIGIRIVSGKEREDILNVRYPPRFHIKRPDHLLLIQAKQKFPPGSQLRLIWSRGVSTPSGIATGQDQILPFKVRNPFTAVFHCQRENPEANCIPISAMKVSFSAPVPWKTAKKATLRSPSGKVWTPSEESEDKADHSADDYVISELTFKAPFPEKSSLVLELPPGLQDESGHALTNAAKFPLTVRTDEYPPLAKFAADFGILELRPDTALPVTLRNVEPEIAGRMFQVPGGEENFDPIPMQPNNAPIAGSLAGKILKVPSDKADQMLGWIRKIAERSWEDRGKSVFGPATVPKTKSFTIPKLHGDKAFEVVGIPLKEPGFYVVEIQSEILGSSLLGVAKPMHVPTTVVVTNLSVHLKWGAQSSLVWVTTLDKAAPVKQASIKAYDCTGKSLWQGTTDEKGIAKTESLPDKSSLPCCSYQRFGGGLLVTAELGNDMAFVHSSWDEGIENWRFRLPTEWRPNFNAAHTILDRSLFRAGETVHMKHILRRKVLNGFALESAEKQPDTLIIQHFGSDQKYELPLKWDGEGVAESSWTIPREAKLGSYGIYIQKKPVAQTGETSDDWDDEAGMQNTGSFRVEEFRVPLMRAVIRPPSGPLVSPPSVPVDLTVSYLSGGGASNLPVKFRYDFRPRDLWEFDGFEDFTFANGKVQEGVSRGEMETEEEEEESSRPPLKSTDLTLDRNGSARTVIKDLPEMDKPMQITAELEFRDPSGEVQTASSTIPLWPGGRLIGIQPDSWMQSKDSLKFKVAVLDIRGKALPNASVKVDVLQKKTYSHRKRLVGGFYAYENVTEIKRLGPLCEGKTDRRGIVICEKRPPVSGELILEAVTSDESGRKVFANREIWIAGENEWWFTARDDDRIDLLPERKHYEPGERARFQVRMPFRKATALVTIEREGVGETFVKELSGKAPVIEIPIQGKYAPNVFVSVLVVRGRVTDVQPTATIDLGRPAYKLGIAEINVGWRSHELKVKVAADRPLYKIRETAKVQVSVTTPDGKPPAKGAEVALAAVDEGLLELMQNGSWRLLGLMMGRRSYNVQTSTAAMHVIGKRHFGLKALPQGGGGGHQVTRELFDTLLLWQGRVRLDEKGMATVEVPLNDSITSFRIVAVATAGVDRFGTGSTSIRSSRDLIILSGIAPVVRQGDRFRSTFTLRNTTERALAVHVNANVSGVSEKLPDQTVNLGSGESKELAWDLTAPIAAAELKYLIEADAGEGISDRLSVRQKVVPATPIRTFQATLNQLTGPHRIDVERPKDAIAGQGGIDVSFIPTLVEGMSGVSDYMSRYPYTCLEQNVSKAVALRDAALWKKIAAEMPAYLDPVGLLKYFPGMRLGSDVLTAYVLSIAHEAGWEIPPDVEKRMIDGLRGFAEGRIVRYSSLPTVDLSIRKLSAIAALSRSTRVNPVLLSSITIEPNLWPSSAVIDWLTILQRVKPIRDQEARLKEAEQILRSRLNFQGTTMTFSTERTDCLWWLMVSPDENSVRLLLNVVDSPAWTTDVGRLVRGALGRQQRGHWDTTVANAWGVLAIDRFSKEFEKTPVNGTSAASLAGQTQTLNWIQSPKGKDFSFSWPPQKSNLEISTSGSGQPWVTIRSSAAIPLKEPLSTGYRIKKTWTPVEQKERGAWSRGDIVRIRLDINAQSDMTWVVVSDPIPAGATILGSGLGRDSLLSTRGEKTEGWAWPAFEERSFETFRAYYEFVPKGNWAIEYTVRLNNEGTMNMPQTRVEAMYSPEMFGELPNEPIRIK